jgi:6-phosphogluconolactonase
MSTDNVYAYVCCGASREIRVLRLDCPSGRLEPVQQIAVDGAVHPAAISPDRRFLHAALRSEPYRVASFAIDAMSGRLTPLGHAPLPASMANISIDRGGRYLFGAAIPPKGSGESGVISIHPIGRDGFVQPAQRILRDDPKIHAIHADPANRHVLATNCYADLILCYDFDGSTGTFAPLPPVRMKPKAGPRHFIFHPNQRFVYLVNETDATIYAFRYDAGSGSLSELQITAMPLMSETAQPMAADIHATPDGCFLYASERVSNSLSAFKIDPVSGLLASIGTFPAPDRPIAFNIDPYGRYLLAGGQNSHVVASYEINRDTGALTHVRECSVGKGPNWIEIVRLP